MKQTPANATILVIGAAIVLTLMSALTQGTTSGEIDAGYRHAIQDERIYHLDSVDVKPSPVKGMEGLFREWQSNAVYPKPARLENVQGKVFVEFIVDSQGQIKNPKVLKGIGYGCDEAAVEALVKANIKWSPAQKDGKPVPVRFVLPFTFRLN